MAAVSDTATTLDPTRRQFHRIELTYLSRQWLPTEDPPQYSFWMASSEVDQKFLGHFAKTTSIENGYLSRYDFGLRYSILESHFWCLIASCFVFSDYQ